MSFRNNVANMRSRRQIMWHLDRSRADVTTGRMTPLMLKHAVWVTLPTFNVQHLLTETDGCHSVAQQTSASTAFWSCVICVSFTICMYSFYPNVTTLRSGLCCRNYVCLSSVTLVHPTQVVEPFGKISSPLCTLAILWPPCKILRM